MNKDNKNLPQEPEQTPGVSFSATQETLSAPLATGEQLTDSVQADAAQLADTAAQAAAQEDVVRNKYADLINKPKKKLPKPVRIGIWAVLAIAVIGGGIYLVNHSKATPANTAATTAIVTRGPLGTYVEGSGTTSAKKQVDLGKDIKGQVTEVLVAAGDMVNAGQTLFVVDPTETRKQLDEAQSSLDDAHKAVDDGVDALRKAQKDQQNLVVTAPFTGKLLPPTGEGATGTIDLKVGQTIAPGAIIGTMVNDSTMILPLYFSYAYIDQLKVGATATVSVPETMSTVSGKVESVEKVEKISNEGVVLFRANLQMQNPGTLKKGMVATAVISSASGDIMPAEAGKLEYLREEDVVAKTGGELMDLKATEFYGYSQGAVLCRLKDENQKAAVESAQRNLASQKKIVVTKQELVQELQKRVADCTVKAPWAGIVLSLTCAEGDQLTASAVPCVVADLTSIVVNASLSELDVDKVKPGMVTMVTMDNGDGPKEYPGKIVSVSMKATMSSGGGGNQGGGGQSAPTFPAVIQLDAMGEGGATLPPDRSVEYKITTAQKDDCLMVASSAIVYAETGAAVFVKPAKGQTFENQLEIPAGTTGIPEGYVLVTVETGLADDTNTEIVAGLEEGMEVFLAGPVDPFADQGGNGGEVTMAVGSAIY